MNLVNLIKLRPPPYANAGGGSGVRLALALDGSPMAELSDHDRVRLLLQELDRVHRESERLRALIGKLQRKSPGYRDVHDTDDTPQEVKVHEERVTVG
jgi:hypothetical protein